MESLTGLAPDVLAMGLGIGFLAGLLKGCIGFGLPTVMIAGLSLIMGPEVALAALALPALVSNGWQALRGGTAAAWASLRRFRVFLLSGFALMVISAQFVPYLPPRLMILLIGVPIFLFALFALMGRHLPIPQNPSQRVQGGVGAISGLIGGVTGMWGPPTVALLTAMQTDKGDQLRIQGVIYGLGAVTLVGSHLVSGVLNAQTVPLSLAMILPALAGMRAGFLIHDWLDQRQFQRLTHVALLIAGSLLMGRGLGII
ncbi:sulfite exporter TauE/SafE family protein [Roseovarius sp. C7]|uniref:sulfite exporter TauE/SafE family protein n=1 Tax=Roseovarius sp. C7 TaxID=3398643 RepID=UPI0039F4C269